MVSDLTPKETRERIAEALHAIDWTTQEGLDALLDDDPLASRRIEADAVLPAVLAAVAAERERVLAAVRNHMGPREFTGLDAEAISRQLGAAREGSRDE